MLKRLLAIALITFAASPVLAQDPGYDEGRPHFYLGVDAGQSTLRNDLLGFDQHGFGFDLRAGIRPIPYLGAEIEYVDLGDRHDFSDECPFHCAFGTHVRAQGGAAFGVLYLPIPHSLVDLYGKAGAARLDTHTTSLVQPCAQCNIVEQYRTDTTNTDFAWGGGVQVHWWNFAVRGEFQQFQTPNGHPSLVSAGFTWMLW